MALCLVGSPAMNPLHFFRLCLAYRWHHRHSRNSGFVMPMVILIGLILTLVGFAMMQRASSQKNDATSKETTAKALSVAEAGIARITNLLNAPSRRFLATLPACNDPFDSRQPGQACNDASSGSNIVVPNWQNLSTTQVQNWTTAAACETVPPSELTAIQALSNNAGWQSLPQGEFRLVGYRFTPTAPNTTLGRSPGTGTLIVEGIVNRGQANEAVSRIQVEIPVQPGPTNNVSVPGLWVTDTNSGSVVGNNTIAGDVLVNDCEGNLAAVSLANTSYTAKYTSADMPSVPPLPATCNNLSAINNDLRLPQRNANNVYTDTQTTVTLNNGTTVPAFVYCVPSIDLNGGNKTLTIETLDTRPTVNSVNNASRGARHMVIFHVAGNVNVQGNAKIVHQCPMTGDTTSCTNYKETDFNLYGRAPAPTGGASLPQICLARGSYVDAFILAPEYEFGVACSGGFGEVRGTVMVKKVSNSTGCGSNTSNFVINQTGNWDDMIDGIQPQPTSPVLSAFSGWTTKPIN